MSQQSFALIIFGITSNLAQIKLIPTLLDMEAKGLLPSETTIVGSARKPFSKEQFEDYLTETIANHNPKYSRHTGETIKSLISKMVYISGDLEKDDFYNRLKELLRDRGEACDNRIFYLATYPELYKTVFDHMKNHKLTCTDCGWTRLMIEKPLGHDLKSAHELNEMLSQYFDEEQVYRLDHYLGKETLQNILTFRFGNGIFEPLMNKDHIDHIQVTVAEDFGIRDRGSYYDTMGAFKDVGQNHLLQMVAFATMDAPAEFTNQAVTHERLRVFNNLEPKELVLGQYEGYHDEKNVSKDSETDTYFAIKAVLNSDRFLGVPIYIRSGKHLPQSAAEISVVFKTPLNRIFTQLPGGKDPNVLIYRIQPNEAIVLKILAKKPGHERALEPAYMQFCYRELTSELPEPYERLFYDAIRGDQTFFTDSKEVEAEWQFVDKALERTPVVYEYKKGTWGPKEADELIKKDGREWLEPSVAFCQI